jgi:hypothetical protein
MSNLICTPTLKCPFCSNESLALFRSKISLQLDIVEAGENKQCVSVTALLCDENHFFFVRSCDVRIRSTNRQEA